MPVSDEPPQHDFRDKVLRDSLRHPEHLRTFLEQAVPQFATGFDCGRARLLDREFPLDDWRRREADLPFEIPYRVGTEEVWALVCVLIEHQSDTDPLMPLRLLYFAVVYWDRQWREWQQLPRPRPTLRLRPVLPIVLYTGARPWGSNRTLADLLDEPAAFHAFAPVWQPLFWNLAEQTPEALLATGAEWLQALAVVRAEGADATTFAGVFTAALRQLEGLHDRDQVRWYDLLRFVLTWALWGRPREEREPLLAAAEATQVDAARQKEVNTVGQTIAEWYMEQGRTEGRGEELRKLLVELGRQRFGEPAESLRAALAALMDLERLERMARRILQASSWQDLLDTP
jgi:hypothetical protein